MYIRSDQIDLLSAALSKAQAEIEVAKFDATNPHFKSKYATLSSVREVVRVPFASNGLAVSQWPSTSSDGIELVTMLTHSSGQWMQASFRLLLQKQDMQGLGSAITYARRYALSALAGVVSDEDDDGNAAVRPGPTKQTVSKPVEQIPAPIDNAMPFDSEWPQMSDQAWAEAASQSQGKPSTVTVSGVVKAMRAQVARNNALPPSGPGHEDNSVELDSSLPSGPGEYVMPCGFNKNKPLKILSIKDIKSTISWAEGALKQKPSGMLSELVERSRAYLAFLEMQSQDREFKSQHGGRP
jgi:hypothetical protein